MVGLTEKVTSVQGFDGGEVSEGRVLQTKGLASDKASGRKHGGSHVITVERVMARGGGDEVRTSGVSHITLGLYFLSRNFGFYPEGEGNGL